MGFMLTCKETTQLIDINEYFDITFYDKLKMNFHLTMCKACKNYYKQNEILNKILIEKYFPIIFKKNDLDAEFTQKFKSQLKEKIKNLE